MNTLTKLSNQYDSLDVTWQKQKDRLDEKLKLQREKIKEEEQNLEKIQQKISKKWDKCPHESSTILKPLADIIGKKLNLIPKISGPYGLNNHYYMSFLDKDDKTIHIMYLRPIEKNGKSWYGLVNTKKVIHPHIHPDSISGMNDDQYEVISLPGSINGIIKFMEKMV
jgi:hypothetical protein